MRKTNPFRDRKILRTPGAAEYVGLAPATLEKMRVHGGGPRFLRLGGRAVGYAIEDLDTWLDGQQYKTVGDVREPKDVE